jgi:hypothetical protein
MPTFDNDTLVKIYAGFAVVIAALIGFRATLRIKALELEAQERREANAQRLTYHLPLLRFCYELDGRINRILAQLHGDWLRSEHLDKIRRGEGFAQNPLETGYFIMSSTYVLACFFGWTEAIKKGVDRTRPLTNRTWYFRLWQRIRGFLLGPSAQPSVFFFDTDISIVRRLFQYQELFKDYSVSKKLISPKDANRLHRHLQHSIGEMMLQPDGSGFRCKTFREFATEYQDKTFQYWFVPLEELIVDLCDFAPGKDIETQAELKNDVRPLRLLAIRYWCRVLMKNLSSDLGIPTPDPEDVLQGLSGSLRNAITGVKIEDLEAHLTAVPHRAK